MPSHPLIHIEIASTDPAASAKFYGDVFGWKITVDQQFDYTQFEAEGGPGGAFPKVDDQMVRPGSILPYIGTDDIEASLKKVEAAGGKTLVPKTEIPMAGWFAVFADTTGASIGLFTEMAYQHEG